ncbi:hypothetical protein AVEN_41906-1 [Araneus ventricosus]|uniref:Uncharacterized protein n=1 Tax=Araneus ventricosus TaxID=182803 RepID=A0A4Y2ADZ1_ARAVE|nr:hypothetical protein AVEN_41906-1 [Araneus ventricosus]
MDLVISNRGQMTNTTLELAPPSPNFRIVQVGGRLATTCDLTCNRPNTRRIFSGIRFQNCKPPAQRPTSYHQSTAASPSICGPP